MDTTGHPLETGVHRKITINQFILLFKSKRHCKFKSCRCTPTTDGKPLVFMSCKGSDVFRNNLSYCNMGLFSEHFLHPSRI